MTSPNVPYHIPLAEPSSDAPKRRYDFDHIPKLGPAKPGDRRGSLLPREGGRPGLTYVQMPLRYVRQAEAAGWSPMFDICRYTIIGPKGSIDMELMAIGTVIPGLFPESTKCPCVAPLKIICEATGLDPNTGFAPTQEALTNAQTQVQEDPSSEAGSLPRDPQPQDPTGPGGGPESDSQTGGGKGKGNPRRS